MINLVNLRKAKGISQQKLGNEIGLARSTICQYERGSRDPDINTLIKIARYFNVSVDYLLGVTDSPWTADDYDNGVRDTKKVSITADQEDIKDKTDEVLERLGEKGKNLIIGFCDLILEKYGN